MKRSLCTSISLFALLAGGSARADLVVPGDPFRLGIDIPMILIVALLIVTALLVRHFTKRK